MIEAKHGTSFSLSRNTHVWTKNFSFLLYQVEEGTLIRMTINPPWHDRYQINANETKRGWLEFTNDLWDDVGVNTRDIFPKELYDPQIIVDELHRLWRNVYLGLLVGIIIYSYIIIGPLFHLPELDILDIAAIMGLTSATMSYMGIGPTKKRITLQSIDLGDFSDAYRSLKYLTLFVLVGCVASSYWILNLDSYTPFSDFGFSFTRN